MKNLSVNQLDLLRRLDIKKHIVFGRESTTAAALRRRGLVRFEPGPPRTSDDARGPATWTFAVITDEGRNALTLAAVEPNEPSFHHSGSNGGATSPVKAALVQAIAALPEAGTMAVYNALAQWADNERNGLDETDQADADALAQLSAVDRVVDAAETAIARLAEPAILGPDDDQDDEATRRADHELDEAKDPRNSEVW